MSKESLERNFEAASQGDELLKKQTQRKRKQRSKQNVRIYNV